MRAANSSWAFQVVHPACRLDYLCDSSGFFFISNGSKSGAALFTKSKSKEIPQRARRRRRARAAGARTAQRRRLPAQRPPAGRPGRRPAPTTAPGPRSAPCMAGRAPSAHRLPQQQALPSEAARKLLVTARVTDKAPRDLPCPEQAVAKRRRGTVAEQRRTSLREAVERHSADDW